MNWQEEQIALLKKGFIVREEILGDDEIVLIYPAKSNMFDINWTEDLLQYRSSMWLKDRKHPISLSFKKFTNWGEREDLFPLPTDLTNTFVMEKLDGSTLAVSRFKDHLITRTRGTIDARILDNGFEIDEFIEKKPKVFDNKWINDEEMTLLFEWVSPFNRIVLDYGDESDIILTGAIYHDTYNLVNQDKLDIIAKDIGVTRPERYMFDTVERMISTIKSIKGKEGICLYYGPDHQNILKVKGTEYLALHAFKAHCHINSIIDMFLEYGKPSYTKFIEEIQTNFDYECSEIAQGLVSIVCDANKKIEDMLNHAKYFAKNLAHLERKDQALIIEQSYGRKTTRAGIVFHMLDNKPISDVQYKRLLYQFTKG